MTKTPSEQCTDAGLESFAELVRLAPWPKQTLLDMYHNYPERFEWVVARAAQIKRETL